MSESEQARCILAVFALVAGYALFVAPQTANAAAPAAGAAISAKQAIAMGVPVDPAIHLA